MTLDSHYNGESRFWEYFSTFSNMAISQVFAQLARGENFMDDHSITQYILDTFEGVETTDNFGYTFFFYGPDRMLPFATIAHEDNEYENISNLNRPGVFRLNIGVSRQTFQSLFGKEKVDINAYDFTALDQIMPHPDYSAQNFVCVLNPSEATFEKVRTLLAEAYDRAVRRDSRRRKQS